MIKVYRDILVNEMHQKYIFGDNMKKKKGNEFTIDYTELQSRIYNLRKQHRYSQEQLAEMIGVDKRTIGNWESGKTIKKIPLEKMVDLCNALECDLRHLTGKSEYETKELEVSCEYTGLSIESCKVLRTEFLSDELSNTIINKFISHRLFPKLIWQILRYTYSHNHKIVIEDESKINSTETIYDPEIVSSFIMNSAVALFSDIIKTFFNEDLQDSKKRMVYSLEKEMLLRVKELSRGLKDPEIRKGVEKMILNYQKDIRELMPNTPIATIPVEMIINECDSLLLSMDR
jgi:transcriptional regulator with XRE-family HTH domain